MHPSTKKYYYLDITAVNCNVTGLLNGFPIYDLKAPSSVNFAMPINTALIGKGNQLSIVLTPASLKDDFNLATFDPMTMKAVGSVKVYGEGEVSAPMNGKRILEFSLEGIPGNYTFDNEGVSFRELFRENPKVEKEKEEEELALLENYAIFLRDIFEAEDIELIRQQFRPKLTDIASAFYKNLNESIVDFEAFIKRTFLPLEPKLNFDESDLAIVPWCDKRIWEIGIWPKKELLITRGDEDGYEYAIKVYVALVDGELKIVR